MVLFKHLCVQLLGFSISCLWLGHRRGDLAQGMWWENITQMKKHHFFSVDNPRHAKTTVWDSDCSGNLVKWPCWRCWNCWHLKEIQEPIASLSDKVQYVGILGISASHESIVRLSHQVYASVPSRQTSSLWLASENDLHDWRTSWPYMYVYKYIHSIDM